MDNCGRCDTKEKDWSSWGIQAKIIPPKLLAYDFQSEEEIWSCWKIKSKCLLIKVKEESEKSSLKLNIQ